MLDFLPGENEGFMNKDLSLEAPAIEIGPWTQLTSSAPVKLSMKAHKVENYGALGLNVVSFTEQISVTVEGNFANFNKVGLSIFSNSGLILSQLLHM